jgi:non-ribosomal peptide synthetase component F
VPLDLAYPRERLMGMIDGCGARRVVTTAAAARTLALPDDRAILLEDLAGDATRRAPVSIALPQEAAAYGIFTSGTTGVPNCVVVSHAAITSTLAWRQRWMPLDKNDRVLQSLSPSFDASIKFFAPLSAGGCVVLSLPGGSKDGRSSPAPARRRAHHGGSGDAVDARGALDDPLIDSARTCG